MHIVRVHGLDVVNAALCLMNMDAFGKASNSGMYSLVLFGSLVQNCSLKFW